MTTSMHTVQEVGQESLIPLSLLQSGQTARVCEVLGSCDTLNRLREMGLFEGAAVQMIRQGSPCILRLQGQRLGLRSNDITKVLVKVNDGCSACR